MSVNLFVYDIVKNPTVSSQDETDKGEGSSFEDQESITSNEPSIIDSTLGSNTTVVHQMGYIPSLGVYSDSSDSESSSSDSDILPSLFTNFSSTAK